MSTDTQEIETMMEGATIDEDDSSLNIPEPEFEHGDIDELLVENKDEIAKLRKLLGSDLPKETTEFPYYDDIFLLRYILSFVKAEDSVERVKKTIAWRNDPKFKGMFEACGTDEGRAWEKNELVTTMQKYTAGGPVDCKKDGAPVIVIRPALGNASKIYDVMTYEEQHMVHFAYREIAFRQCDAITRKTRKIVKQLLIFDMNGVKFGEMMDRRAQKVHEPVSKACSNYYPQLQSKFVMIHAPNWIQMVFALMRKILPKRNINKMALCPASAGKGDASKCPYASKFLNAEKVPDFLGGRAKVSDLHPAVSGANLVKKEEEETGTSLTIGARSQQTVTVDVPCGNVEIKWILRLENKGINMSAILKPEDESSDVVIRAPVGDGTEKIKAENGLAKGSWDIPKAGTLHVLFDNSYSMLRSKTLSYEFQITFKETS